MVSGELPGTPKGRATRARIVAAASDLVFLNGVVRTSLDDVGTAARVGKSQLYHYFADKAALVREVVDRQADLVLRSQGAGRTDLDSWSAWTRWRDDMVDAQRASHCIGGCPLGSLANELSDSDDDARDAIGRGFDRWEAFYHDGLERMREAGLLRPDTDVHALATLVLGAVQGGLILCTARKSTEPLEIALDGALAAVRGWAT